MINSCSIKFSYQRRLASGGNSAPVVRRAPLSFSHSTERPISLTAVTTLAKQLYSLGEKFDVSLSYLDEDSDVVLMSSELEFDEYLQQLRTAQQVSGRKAEVLKFGLHLSLRPQVNQKVVPLHPHVAPSTAVAAAVPEKDSPEEVQGGRPPLLNAIRACNCAAGADVEKAHLLKQAAILAAQASSGVKLRDTNSSAATECRGFKMGVLKAIEEDKSEIIARNSSSYMFKLPPSASIAPALISTPAIAPSNASSALLVHKVGPSVYNLRPCETSFRTSWVLTNNAGVSTEALTFVFSHGAPIPVAGASPDSIHRFRYNIGTINANSTRKIVLNLSAPTGPGCHTAHYQLINKDGAKVGNSLEVTVNRPSAPVTAPPKPPATVTFLAGRPDMAVTAPPRPAAAAPPVAPLVTPPVAPLVTPPVAPLVTPPVAPLVTPPVASPAAPPTRVMAARPHARLEAAADQQVDRDFRVWAAELAVLKQMGFFDRALNVQLLKKHVKSPSKAPVGAQSNLSNYALNEIVAELFALGESEEFSEKERRDLMRRELMSAFEEDEPGAASAPQLSTAVSATGNEASSAPEPEPEDMPIFDVGSGSSSGEEDEEEEDFVMLIGDGNHY